jgi:hypothetical protein
MVRLVLKAESIGRAGGEDPAGCPAINHEALTDSELFMLYRRVLHLPQLSKRTSPDFHSKPWQIADTKTRVYLRLVVSCGVLWCANLLTDRVIQSRGRPMGYVRDVGVAGSNPVTPTIEMLMFFLSQALWGLASTCTGVQLGSSFDARESPRACFTADYCSRLMSRSRATSSGIP